jgi:predicted KAP-like P-loop ATPase
MNDTATLDAQPGKNAESADAVPFSPDKPLMLPEQDRLGRAKFAKFLAKAIVEADIEEGFVLALYGAWGSGKSSTLNFVIHYVQELGGDDAPPIIVAFNPWWFSGRHQLLEQFFRQLRTSIAPRDATGRLKRLGDRIGAAGKVIEGIGKAPVPVAKDIIGPLGELIRLYGEGVSKVGESLDLDVSDVRRKLEDSLSKLDRRILIVLDDVDRLPQDEVRDVFRLIKAIADLPKTVYLLAFDRDVVVSALADKQVSGEAYLEKIVQAGFDLPLPERVRLRGLLFEQLSGVLSGTPPALWDETYWYNLYVEGVDAFIRTPRDIKRYLNVLRPSYSVVRGEVNAADFLAIEALRVFVPPVYYEIRAMPELFVGRASPWSSMGSGRSAVGAKEAFRAVLQQVGNKSYGNATDAVLKRLFPRYAEASGGPLHAAEWEGKWRKQCRICSAEVFPVYFRLALPTGAFSREELEDIIRLAENPGALTEELRRLASQEGSRPGWSRAREFLHHLPDYTREDFPENRIEGLVQSLHNVGDDLIRADDRPGPYEFGNEIHAIGIAHQLLYRISDEPRRSEILSRVLRTAESIPLMVHELHVLGQQHGRYGGLSAERPEEDRLVSASHVDDLQMIVRDRIRNAAVSDALRTIPQLGYVLQFWQVLGGDEPARRYVSRLIGSDEGVATLVEGVLGTSYSQFLTDQVGRTHYQISIPQLARLVDPEELRAPAERIVADDPEWLSERQRLALEVFLRDLKNKPDGYGPLDTPD